ncbi:MAG: ATP-binding protein [Actinomycetota bacterium]
MNTRSVSPKVELDSAIQSYNPFRRAIIEKVQSVWEQDQGSPDLEILNAKAFQKVLEVIKQVKICNNTNDKVATLVVTGDVGSGKTKLPVRLCHHLIGDGTALFVYANAGQYGDLNLLRYQFLQTLVQELARIGHEKVTQWQEVAAAIANASNPNAQQTPSTTLVKNFDKAYAKALTKNSNLIKWLSAQILKAKPDADPYILRAILWTLSQSYAPYAVEWLAGNELDQETAKALGLPTNANRTALDKEAEALNTINKILRLVSDYKPVLICFDELETQGKLSEDGFTKAQVIARLIKDLYDNLEQSRLGKGVIILTVIMTSTWTNDIGSPVSGAGLSGAGEGVGGGIVDRMSTATHGKPLLLEPINSQLAVDLVALWLKTELYEPRNLTPHDPVYPFSENQLREIGKNKPTVREFLVWCDQNYKINNPPALPLQRYELALKQANESAPVGYLENNALIADALHFGFETLIGQPLEGITATGERLKQLIIQTVEPVGGSINLKVSGTEKGNKRFVIGVAVIQEKSAIVVKKGLNNLIDYNKFGLTRGCLVRSKDRKINKSAQAYKYLKTLTEKQGGEWAYLDPKDIKLLIDIHTVYQQCESYHLTKEQVLEFSSPKILENSLLQEILSDPSGEIDAETINDDNEEDALLISLFEENSEYEGANDEEISSLFD